MQNNVKYPTELHEKMAELAMDFFALHSQVDTVLLVNSCARGQATPESDVDMAVLARPETSPDEISKLEQEWLSYSAAHPTAMQYKASSRFAQIHLDVITGQFAPSTWDDGGGPDSFEIEVGNRVAYSAPLGKAGDYFQELQAQWLPFYNETLQQERLQMVITACEYDLEHVPLFTKRGLYFQAFDRLYKAYQEFLQALFISRRTYPIAYNKWIHEQVAKWLNLPELYSQLPKVLSITDLESSEIESKADSLNSLVKKYLR